jgi:uncharacterized protein
MLTLLSPAKKLLNFNKPYLEATTTPAFHKKTDELIGLMKSMSVSSIAQLMHLSETLAELNYQRYQAFYRESCPLSHCYPALFLFQGDVYQSLKAGEWDRATVEFSQSHLAILSGLYGLLRPLDLIQPYRLEMGTKLPNNCGKNLYDFWQITITNELNNRLLSEETPVLINLASTEYFSAVDKSLLKAPLITIHFLEQKNDQLKVVGIHAKKARGAMANYIMTEQIENIEKIKEFSLLNYRYCEKSSDGENFNFIRETT